MKKLTYLLASILVLSLTSMMLTQNNDDQNKPDQSFDAESKSLYYKGTITIKVKEHAGEFESQRGLVTFNLSSLDAKAANYQVDLLEKRFRYNPKKLKKGMPDLSRIYRIEFPEHHSVTRVAKEFARDPNIEYAEPIPVVHFFDVPNDSLYFKQDYLPQISAPSAWDIHKGEDGPDDILIGVVDTGTEWDHEDLIDNIWQNMGEDADGDGNTLEYNGSQWIFDPDDENGVDDDGNGYIDDFIGWNFDLNSNDPYPIQSVYKWTHGTFVAGIAGATTNNGTGVASLGWNIKIIPLQMGYIGTLQAFDAIIYAAENGADVINASWGYEYVISQAHLEAVNYVRSLGSIIVNSAGNMDVYWHHYPADYPGVLGVAAVDNMDKKASYSCFGPNIAICAPTGEGEYNIWTTSVYNNYISTGGTSAAAPIVTALLGLVKSYHPDWTSDQVITQVLGTADDIDPINPGYENLLGAGRINAYRALTEDNVTLQQEIAIDLIHADFQDLDGDHFIAPGDTIFLDLKLINFKFGIEAENSTFTLSTADPDITMLNNTCTADIPADDYFELDSAFQFFVSESAETHIANFELVTEADKEITWGDTLTFDLIIAPSGILVYQGTGFGDNYSGDFINEYLVNQGYQVLYDSTFPASLIGFDAVFLSYGNCGIDLKQGTEATMEMVERIIEYTYQGGNVYVESGTFFTGQIRRSLPNTDEIMELFGVDELDFMNEENEISMLSGLEGSICQDLVYQGSSQPFSWYISTYTPDENGVAAFEEDEYGTVAVQVEGAYGQKTFCFSYALAHLEDGEHPNTREELLRRICEFFDIQVGIDLPQSSDLHCHIYPNPSGGSTVISYELENEALVDIEVYNLSGQKVQTLLCAQQTKGTHQYNWDASALPNGIYLIRLTAGQWNITRKIIKQ